MKFSSSGKTILVTLIGTRQFALMPDGTGKLTKVQNGSFQSLRRCHVLPVPGSMVCSYFTSLSRSQDGLMCENQCKCSSVTTVYVSPVKKC